MSLTKILRFNKIKEPASFLPERIIWVLDTIPLQGLEQPTNIYLLSVNADN